eukprot:Hpha_TRINITY_DN30982_c0_g1::TRINITY_DN30982_c0_g1_i1::g.112216::m.112216/K03031/PSMD8, RPN12; 26S proteasome regulatory subunit N12
MADSAAAVKEAYELLLKYKDAFSKKDHGACATLLSQLKRLFTKLPTFLSPAVDAPGRAREVILVRDTFEHACLETASRVPQDPQVALAEFGRHYEVLRTYYEDFTDVAASERRLLVVGLNLLRLLALGDSKSFHMELEGVGLEDQETPYVKDVVQLERYLEEGSYNKLLDARKKVPSSDYSPLMDMLLDTVRRGVFECAPTAYTSLSKSAACGLLMFTGAEAEKQMVEYIRAENERRRGQAELSGETYTEAWKEREGRFVFREEGELGHKKESLPFDAVMRQQLDFAHELQRVV